MRLPITIPTFTANLGHPLNQGLVGWWLATPGYNGFGSSKWLDLSPYHNDGTLTNMAPASDWTGAGLDFDNTDDNVNCGDASAFSPASAITVAAFVNPASIPAAASGNRTWVMTKGASNQFEWQLSINSFSSNYGKWVFTRYGILTGDSYRERASSTDATASSWQFIVATTSSTSATPDVYVNGVLDNGASASDGSMSDTNGTAAMLIGERGDNADHPWHGLIRSVSIYNRAISASEVAQLYREVLTGYPNLLNRVRVPVYAPAAAAGGFFGRWYYDMIGQERIGA